MKSIEDRKRRWLDLYKADGRTKVLYLIGCSEAGEPPRPMLWPEMKEDRIDWAWNRFLTETERAKWLDDDYIPYMSVTSGTEIFAEAFGAGVHRPYDNMPFAIPFITSPLQAEKIKVPKLEDTPLMLLFSIADELVKRGGRDIPLQLPDMQSPMDVVAQIWDKTDLFPSMIEAPEAVIELAEKVKTLQFEFLDRWFSQYGTSYIAHFPAYYMEGGITFSVDEIGSVSTDMYSEFFADELNEMSRRYGGIGIHSCSDSKHQWENIRKTEGLVMINICRPEKLLDESYEFFKETAAMWPINMRNNIGTTLTRKRRKEYPEGCRMVITESVISKDDAIRLASEMREEYGG